MQGKVLRVFVLNFTVKIFKQESTEGFKECMPSYTSSSIPRRQFPNILRHAGITPNVCASVNPICCITLIEGSFGRKYEPGNVGRVL